MAALPLLGPSSGPSTGKQTELLKWDRDVRVLVDCLEQTLRAIGEHGLAAFAGRLPYRPLRFRSRPPLPSVCFACSASGSISTGILESARSS